MESLVSIIVPVYNVEKYLKKCINSILRQTYQNIEVILVDDGSVDRSGEICDEYSVIDGRIKVVHKKNGGLSDARNTGLEIAMGEYISFIDSDDYVSEDIIELLHRQLCCDNSDMALCNMLYVDEMGHNISKLNKEMPIKNTVLSQKEFWEYLYGEKYWYYIVSCSKLYKRELFKNIYFPKGKIHEDEFLIHRIIDRCSNISCIEKPMYFYVQRENSIMNSSFTIKKLDGAEALFDRTFFALERELYSLAKASYNLAIGILLQGYGLKNINDVEKLRLKELKKIYNCAFYKMLRRGFIDKHILKFLILRISFPFYEKIIKFLKRKAM